MMNHNSIDQRPKPALVLKREPIEKQILESGLFFVVNAGTVALVYFLYKTYPW